MSPNLGNPTSHDCQSPDYCLVEKVGAMSLKSSKSRSSISFMYVKAKAIFSQKMPHPAFYPPLGASHVSCSITSMQNAKHVYSSLQLQSKLRACHFSHVYNPRGQLLYPAKSLSVSGVLKAAPGLRILQVSMNLQAGTLHCPGWTSADLRISRCILLPGQGKRSTEGSL